MSLNISINLQHGAKRNTMPAVISCHLTECKQKRRFAYTGILKKPPNFDENGLKQGFSRFFEEMRLNQLHAETQYVTIKNQEVRIKN